MLSMRDKVVRYALLFVIKATISFDLATAISCLRKDRSLEEVRMNEASLSRVNPLCPPS